MYLLMSETDGAAVLCRALFFSSILPKTLYQSCSGPRQHTCLVLPGLVAAFLLPALDLSTLSQSVLHQMRGSTACSRDSAVCWQEDGMGSMCALVSLLVEHPERVAWLGALTQRLRRALREPK